MVMRSATQCPVRGVWCSRYSRALLQALVSQTRLARQQACQEVVAQPQPLQARGVAAPVRLELAC